MAIEFNEKCGTISLHTGHTTYQMAIGPYGFLLHTWYGSRISCDMRYVLSGRDRGFSGNPYDAGNDRTFSLDALPQEYPCSGCGDYRMTDFSVENENGVCGCDLRYVSHEIRKGKYSIPGLPAVYAKDNEAETLEVVLCDQNTGVRVTLLYGVLEKEDVITRCAAVENTGGSTVSLKRAFSASLDFVCGQFDLIHFHGRHGNERMPERTPVLHARQDIGSIRGTSSHEENPFAILADRKTTEDSGPCYGMSVMYSGNFRMTAEKDQYDQTRMTAGLQDEMFSYDLQPGEIFHTPEVIMAYSAEGLGALSRIYHDVIRNHVCRGKYQLSDRPILINNWEATGFQFTGEKIIRLAEEAREIGAEMLVLDDGWFGGRNSDNAGLGDWQVNETKLGGPLSGLVRTIHEKGMKFGIWIEPEMVNEDSNLYREHPDWAFVIPGKKPVRGRNQLVLDFSREEVVGKIFDDIAEVLSSADIDYVKMDMNRSIADVYSAAAGKQNCGKILYRYVLGVYSFLERLAEKFPDILIEGCSGGGGRFDAGMLYYTPQIWCSDDTDAIERAKIQQGTSYGYPVSTVGSHVTVVPNEQTGRVTKICTRAVVAMSGSYGFELDPGKLSTDEKKELKKYTEDYKKYRHLIREGLYYRTAGTDPADEIIAWNFTARDQSEALLNIVTLDTHCNAPQLYAKCRGLDPNSLYREEESGRVVSGSALSETGIPVPYESGEYNAWQIHFVKV